MTQLLNSLIQIALLRKDPGILPASIVLLVLTAAGFAGSSALLSYMAFGGDRLWLRTALDLGLTLLPFWLMFAAIGRSSRFRQTTTAVLGTAVLLTPLIVGILLLHRLADSTGMLRLLIGIGYLTVIAWYALVVGHILRSALEIAFLTGVAIALTWLFASEVLTTRLFAVPA